MADKYEDPGWSDLWQMIDDRRSELGLSLGQLYERSGVSQRTFADMRTGRPLKSREKLAGICKALRWTPDAVEHFWLDGERPWSIEYAIRQANELLSTSEFYAAESGSGEEIRDYRWAKSNLVRLLQWQQMLDESERRRTMNEEFAEGLAALSTESPSTSTSLDPVFSRRLLDELVVEVRQLAQAVEFLAARTGVDLTEMPRADPDRNAAAQ